ncbi:MAG: nuclear transport factor 2 family protein [Gammaproteobacteria bacterium]|nr:nuclear transport factor 2 family protein [Gammaproteobacteria bacterium]
MTQTAEQVWQDYMVAVKNGGNRWQELLNDSVSFTGPLVQLYGKDEFVKMTGDFFKMISNYEIERTLSGGDAIAVEAKISVNSPTGKQVLMDVAELYTVKDGKIQAVKMYYDPTEFRQEFGI